MPCKWPLPTFFSYVKCVLCLTFLVENFLECFKEFSEFFFLIFVTYIWGSMRGSFVIHFSSNRLYFTNSINSSLVQAFLFNCIWYTLHLRWKSEFICQVVSWWWYERGLWNEEIIDFFFIMKFFNWNQFEIY